MNLKVLPGQRLRRLAFLIHTIVWGSIVGIAIQLNETIDAWPWIAIAIAVGAAGYIFAAVNRAKDIDSPGSIAALLVSIVIYASCVTYVQVVGESSATTLLATGALVVLLLLHIGLLFTSGTAGQNRFGDDPRGRVV